MTDWTDGMIATARKLQAEGYSTALIGERLGVGKNAVVGKLRRLRCRAEGLPAHPKITVPKSMALKPRNFAEPVPPPNPAARYEAMGTERKPCEFPIGDRREYKTCGQDRVIGKPYCPGHCAKVYVRVIPPSQREAATCP